MQQQYSDLPTGAQVVNQPQASSAAYSDLPQGAQLVHDPNDSGAFKRFAARALGVPEDVFSHPNKWLNPFSKDYNSPEHKQEALAATVPDPVNHPPSGAELIPGHQTYQDIKSGNYAGAAGDVVSTAGQLAPLLGIGKSSGAPVEVPNVYDGPVPSEIPAGRPQTSNTVAHVVKQVAPLLAREVTGKLPLLDRLADTRVPTLSEYGQAIRSRPSAPEEVPQLSTSANEVRGPYQAYQGDLTVAPEIKQPVPRNAPVRGGSQTVQTFTGSTPEEIAANAARIATNQASRKLAPDAAGQVPTPQEAAPAVAEQSGVLGRLPSESALSGESALRQVLTGQDNANLMRIAKSRGINVTREAQLKPGIADKFLVNKIIDDFGPDELDEVSARYLEANRFKHNFGDVGPEAWKSMSMQTYFPDVNLPAAMIKRVNAAIQSNAQPQTAVSPKAVAQAQAAQAPIPQELAQPSISEALRQSLAQRGIVVDANGKIIKGAKAGS